MEDVSKEVVAVILVIAIVISVLGTWLVLDSATSVNTPKAPRAGSSLEGKGNIGAALGEVNLPTPIKMVDDEVGNIQLRLTK